MSDTPDPRAFFLDRVASLAAEMDAFDEVLRDSERFGVIVRRQGTLHHCAVENLYLSTRELPPEEREAEVRAWLDVMTKEHRAPETWEEARPLLRPVLRTPGIFATTRLEARRAEFVLSRVTPMLRFALVLDLPQRMAWLRSQEVAAWGVSEELARQVALENLADAASEGIEPYDPTAASPIFHVNSDDGYESSRLLLPGWLAAFAGQVEGPPIAAIPHRNALIVTGGGRVENIERLVRIARDEYSASPGPVSPAIYTVARDGEGIELLRMPGGHPAGGIVDEARARLIATEYEEQRAVFDELGPERGWATPAAPIEVWRRALAEDDADYVCAARWDRGDDSLLPETDVVRLVDGDDERQMPWEKLRRRWPQALEEVEGADPPRWRTMHWPEEPDAD